MSEFNENQGQGLPRRRNNWAVMFLTFAIGAAAMLAFALALTLAGFHE